MNFKKIEENRINLIKCYLINILIIFHKKIELYLYFFWYYTTHLLQ